MEPKIPTFHYSTFPYLNRDIIVNVMPRSFPCSERHLFHQGRQISGDQRRRAAAHLFKSALERGADFLGFAHGLAVAVTCLGKFRKVRRRIEDTAFVVFGAHRDAVWISA